MSLSQVPVQDSSVPYDAASGVNLITLKAWFDALHLKMNSNMRADGGSVEDGEAQVTLGTTTLGIQYQHPRENYENHDRLIVVAEYGPENQFRQNIDFAPQPGDTQDVATARWINAARSAALTAIATLGLTFRNILPDPIGVSYGPVNEQPGDELD